MSTSRERKAPLEYMDGSAANVLWELQPGAESDAAFHCGADVSLLSQFAFEKEVLFPPYTMMLVLGGNGAGSVAGGRERKEAVWDRRAQAERTRQYVAVSVRPYFV
jgi:hypothetical protein